MRLLFREHFHVIHDIPTKNVNEIGDIANVFHSHHAEAQKSSSSNDVANVGHILKQVDI